MQVMAIDELINKTESIYKLVILTSLRAIELSEGAANLVNAKKDSKPINVALEEIREGKISYKIKDKK